MDSSHAIDRSSPELDLLLSDAYETAISFHSHCISLSIYYFRYRLIARGWKRIVASMNDV